MDPASTTVEWREESGIPQMLAVGPRGRCPELQLLAKVIQQAWSDVFTLPHGRKEWEMDEAKRFFYDGRLEIFCHAAGWNPQQIREKFEASLKRFKRGCHWMPGEGRVETVFEMRQREAGIPKPKPEHKDPKTVRRRKLAAVIALSEAIEDDDYDSDTEWDEDLAGRLIMTDDAAGVFSEEDDDLGEDVA